MLARALLARRALCAGASRTRPASALATAGLDADTADLWHAASDFAARELAPHSARWDEEKRFPLDTFRTAASAGFAALTVSPDHGGTGLTRAAAAAVYEALAGGDISFTALLSIHSMVASAIDAHGTPAQKATWLPRLAGGDVVGAYCLTEPGAGSDAAALRTAATPAGGDDAAHHLLTGEKVFISGASLAGVFLVMARTGGPGAGGISAFLVDGADPGVAVGPPEHKMGWNAQPTCSVSFERARGEMLGAEGGGFGQIAMRALDGGRVNIGAISVGGASAAVGRARAHAAARTQFGSPILDFQATRFALADAATGLHAARLLVRSAAAALDAGHPTATLQAAAAKRFASDTAFDAANAALQVFGGYGYLKEYGAEQAVRDLRVHSLLEGTNQIMRVVISRELERVDGR